MVNVLAASGRPIEELTLANGMSGRLGPEDLRIHPATLLRQADMAGEHGNHQLAENLRRAAELCALSDEDVLGAYEALRPGRSTREQLEALADKLSIAGARRCADLVREACVAYERRGLLAR